MTQMNIDCMNFNSDVYRVINDVIVIFTPKYE
jgi:hypothetical protein